MASSASPNLSSGLFPKCLVATSQTLVGPLLRGQSEPLRAIASQSDRADLNDAWPQLVDAATTAPNLDALQQAVSVWLRRLGWPRIELDPGNAENATTSIRRLRAAFNQQKLSVWLWNKQHGLDSPVVEAGTWCNSPSSQLAQHLVAHNEHLGILLSASELRVVIVDRDGSRHHYSALLQQLAVSELTSTPCDHRLIASWCSPVARQWLDSTLSELHRYRKALLERIQDQMQSGAERFLSVSIATPANRRALDAQAAPDATASRLWQDTILFGFCLLASAIAEARVSESDPTRCGRRRPTFEVIALLQSQSTVNWVEVLRSLLNHFGHGHAARSRPTASLSTILPGDVFSQLGALEFEPDAARELLASALLMDQSNLGLESCVEAIPFDALSADDLAHVFESMLNLCPGIARTALFRHRRGKYDVITSTRTSPNSRAAQPHAPQKCSRSNLRKQIPAGSFYVYASHQRKSLGAYYTPLPLVDHLVSATLAADRQSKVRQCGSSIESILSTRILDPATGAGAFLLSATRSLGDDLLRVTASCYFELKLPAPDGNLDTRDSGGSAVGRIPDVGTRLVACLHDTTASAGASDDCWEQARDLCRAAVAASCIYGVDKNPLAAVFTRLLLWLECHRARTELAHLVGHIISGDSLIGPQLAQLFTLPHSGEPLALTNNGALEQTLHHLLSEHRTATISPRRSLNTYDAPQSAAIAAIVATWAGGVMLGSAQGDDKYVTLLSHLGAGVSPEECLAADAALSEQSALGKPALCFDLSFPDVFPGPTATTAASGFCIIVGNPPWDAVKANSREVLAEFDPRVFDLNTRSERDALVRELSQSPPAAARLKAYADEFSQRKRAHDRQFQHQKLMIQGDLAGRQLDLFRLFIERSWQLLRTGGQLGMVVPSAFHTAAGAVGVRRLLLESGKLCHYAVFRNSQKIFDISRGFEFALLLAEKTPTADYPVVVRFGLENPLDLMGGRTSPNQVLSKSAILSGSAYATIEVTSDDESRAIVASIRRCGCAYSTWEQTTGVRLRSTPTSVHRTHESPHFEALGIKVDRRLAPVTAEDVLIHGVLLHEGATFHRYNDVWGEAPRYNMAARRLVEIERWRHAVGHYRIAMRAIVGSSPHKCIATLLPPGTLVTNSALVEAAPGPRPSAYALVTIAVLNSSVANWLFCARADLNVNLFALRQLAWPESLPMKLLAHSALRLCALHAHWKPLWREQLAESWHEDSVQFTWPAIPNSATRTSLIATVDAAVAAAYGLAHAEYARVLRHFGADWQGAPATQCLDLFDDIASVGIESFARRKDPYEARELVLSPPHSQLDLASVVPNRPT